MNNDISVLNRNLNILGLLLLLLAGISYIVFFNIEEYHEGIYFLLATCTSLIISVLTLGISIIIKLLDQDSK